jgi:hypothetical protein
MTKEDRAALHATLEGALPLPPGFWGRKWSYTGARFVRAVASGL